MSMFSDKGANLPSAFASGIWNCSCSWDLLEIQGEGFQPQHPLRYYWDVFCYSHFGFLWSIIVSRQRIHRNLWWWCGGMTVGSWLLGTCNYGRRLVPCACVCLNLCHCAQHRSWLGQEVRRAAASGIVCFILCVLLKLKLNLLLLLLPLCESPPDLIRPVLIFTHWNYWVLILLLFKSSWKIWSFREVVFSELFSELY